MTQWDSKNVRDLILHRARTGSRPRHRDDGATVALCIEGGGMRGVVSAGMVVAIEQLGILRAFDRIYGASAGAPLGRQRVPFPNDCWWLVVSVVVHGWVTSSR